MSSQGEKRKQFLRSRSSPNMLGWATLRKLTATEKAEKLQRSMTANLGMAERAILLDSESHRKREKYAKKLAMNWSSFMDLYHWMERHLIYIVGSQIDLAYRDLGRYMGRREFYLSSTGYIITQSIDVVLDDLLDYVEHDHSIQEAFATLWSDRKIYKNVIEDIITKARIETFRHYGVLMKSVDLMLKTAGLPPKRRSCVNLLSMSR